MRARGFTLIEAMVAMTVMAIGLLGLASLQVVGVRATFMATRMAGASALAQDLAENMNRWPYDDTRLAATRSSISDLSSLDATSDLGRNVALPYTPDFGEGASGQWTCGTCSPTTPSATTNNALGVYAGVRSPTDSGAGTNLYDRYWNVYPMSGSNGTGKAIQIIVRWPEGNFGVDANGNPTAKYRQIVLNTFKADPNSLVAP